MLNIVVAMSIFNTPPTRSLSSSRVYTYTGGFVPLRKHYRPREPAQHYIDHDSNLAFQRGRRRDKSIDSSTHGAGDKRANRFEREFEANGSRAIGVGEAWSENRHTDHRVQGVPAQRSGQCSQITTMASCMHGHSFELGVSFCAGSMVEGDVGYSMKHGPPEQQDRCLEL